MRSFYWLLPVFSAAVWLGMLLGMLLGWIVDSHSTHYVYMDVGQRVAYISDIGASHRLKPLFIAGSSVTTAVFDLSLLADRYLRHRGRLTRNTSRAQTTLASLAIFFAVAGMVGLILLSVFDVAHHDNLHHGFLVLFLVAYIISAIFACWEFQRLGRHYRDIRILKISFWTKLVFIVVEIALAITFACLSYRHHSTTAAIVEWIIALIFTFYVLSYAMDLYPAAPRTRRHRHHAAKGSLEGFATDTASAATPPPPRPAQAHVGVNGLHANPVYPGHPPLTNGTSAAVNEDPYGQSAARATRGVRANRDHNGATTAAAAAGSSTPIPLADLDNDTANNSSTSHGPEENYQPGRRYGH